MKSVKGSQTEKNLLASFAGESQARNRYTYFASVAKKEGYEQISAIFTERLTTKRNTLNVFSAALREVRWRYRPPIRPVSSAPPPTT
jgi:rubrerythrin